MERLLAAAKNGNIEQVRNLLAAGYAVNGFVDGEARTALDAAIERDLSDLAELLLVKGSKTYRFGEGCSDGAADGRLSLTAVARGRRKNVVRMLVARGWDPNGRDYNIADTPLHAAIKSGAEDLAQDLLAAGVDASLRDGQCKDALALASEWGMYKTVTILTEDRDRQILESWPAVTLNASQEEVLGAAIVRGHRDLIDELMPRCNLGRLGKEGCTAEFWAAYLGDLPTINELRKGGAWEWGSRNDGWSHSPIWVAARYGHSDVVEMLLSQKHFGTSISESLPVWVAAQMGQVAVLRLLLKQENQIDCLNRNYPRFTPLGIAAEFGQAHAIEVLLEHGADPDGIEGQIRPPVNSAWMYHNLEAFNLLRGAGAKFDSRWSRRDPI